MESGWPKIAQGGKKMSLALAVTRARTAGQNGQEED